MLQTPDVGWSTATFLKKGERPLTGTRPNKLWLCPPKEDKIDFFTRFFKSHDTAMLEHRAMLQQDAAFRLPVVFVQFKDIVTAQQAAQCHVHTPKV